MKWIIYLLKSRKKTNGSDGEKSIYFIERVISHCKLHLTRLYTIIYNYESLL